MKRDNSTKRTGRSTGVPGVRQCEVCEKTVGLMTCKKCMKVYYCSKSHQIFDWNHHKKRCTKLLDVNDLPFCIETSDFYPKPSKCEVCEKTYNLKMCSRCKWVFYCGREHQMSDWQKHKRLCKRIRKYPVQFVTQHNIFKVTRVLSWDVQGICGLAPLPFSLSSLDRVLSDKEFSQAHGKDKDYEFDEKKFEPIEKKKKGSAHGTIYRRTLFVDIDSQKESLVEKWLGKVPIWTYGLGSDAPFHLGTGEGTTDLREKFEEFITEVRGIPNKSLAFMKEELEVNCYVALEFIANNLYRLFSAGMYETPMTRIAKLPITNKFSKTNPLEMFDIQSCNRVMTRWCDGYRDLKDLRTDLDGKLVSFMRFFRKTGKLPEYVSVAGAKLTNSDSNHNIYNKNAHQKLSGLLSVLAVSRCLCDVDVLGRTGENIGFVEHNGRIKIVKIDPGCAFLWAKEWNWVENEKDIPLFPGASIKWDALSIEQKNEYLENLLHCLKIAGDVKILDYLFENGFACAGIDLEKCFNQEYALAKHIFIFSFREKLVEHIQRIGSIYEKELVKYNNERWIRLGGATIGHVVNNSADPFWKYIVDLERILSEMIPLSMEDYVLWFTSAHHFCLVLKDMLAPFGIMQDFFLCVLYFYKNDYLVKFRNANRSDCDRFFWKAILNELISSGIASPVTTSQDETQVRLEDILQCIECVEKFMMEEIEIFGKEINDVQGMLANIMMIRGSLYLRNGQLTLAEKNFEIATRIFHSLCERSNDIDTLRGFPPLNPKIRTINSKKDELAISQWFNAESEAAGYVDFADLMGGMLQENNHKLMAVCSAKCLAITRISMGKDIVRCVNVCVDIVNEVISNIERRNIDIVIDPQMGIRHVIEIMSCLLFQEYERKERLYPRWLNQSLLSKMSMLLTVGRTLYPEDSESISVLKRIIKEMSSKITKAQSNK